MPEIQRFLITSAPGLEGLLAEELGEFGVNGAAEPSGAVAVDGGWVEAARVLVRSRIASRVALSLRRFSARNAAMLYDQVRRVDWPALLPRGISVAVEASGSTEETGMALSFVPLKIKDAVVDEFRKRGLPRPDVDRRDPGARIRAFFHAGGCELSLDLTGEPLHRRGYRRDGAEAPLRENRAAALLRFAGYDGSRPLADPFCGSGTIAIEGALIAARIAPGLLRPVEAFALPRLFREARPALERERKKAEAERREPPNPIAASDLDAGALATARKNAEKAGVARWITVTRGDARELEAPPGWIVTNPPYGERLADLDSAAQLLDAFVRQVKHHAAGSRLALVVPQGKLEKSVGLRPQKKLAVSSGPMRLRYLVYEIRAGKYKGDG